MNKITIAKIIAGLSIITGFVVMIGWYLDITILTSILPEWIRMKFATAISFVFAGVIVYFLTFKKEEQKESQQIALTIFPMMLVLVMGTLFLGSLFGFQTGMENIAFIDIHELRTPIFQGRPSVATMFMFILIALIGFLFNFNQPSKRTFSLFGGTVGVLGFIGIIGYITKTPVLYYEIVGFSNAIALHTTILFALLGLAIYLVGSERSN